MAERGGPGTRSLVPLGGLIVLVLALGVVLLAVRSSKSPTNNAAPAQPSPSAGTPSSGAPSPGAPTAVPAPGAPSAPGVLPGMPVQPTTAPSSPATPSGPSGRPGTSPGTSGLPNTGGPFPWWLGLLPISLGLGLMRALHRRPATEGPTSVAVGPGVAPRGITSSGPARRPEAARHRDRPPPAWGPRRP